MHLHRRLTLIIGTLSCLGLITLAGLAVTGCGSSASTPDAPATTASTTTPAGDAIDPGVTTDADADSDAVALFPIVVDDRLGFIDRRGDVVIVPQFEPWPYSYFSDGLAPVSAGPDREFGYIDRTGSMVIEARFIFADPFSEGLAAVVDDNGLWGFIDKTGTIVIPGRYAEKPGHFTDGLCMVFVDDPHGSGEIRSAFIDRHGTEVIGPFEWVGNFSEGLAPIGSTVDGVLRWGFIDTSGTVVIVPQFDEVDLFSEGLAPAVSYEEAGPDSDYVAKYGYIDKTGAIVIEPQFEWAGEFSEGLAAVGYADGVWGYIDTTGTLVIPFELGDAAWAGAYPFSHGLGRFDVMDDNGSTTPIYIDKTGAVIWPKG